MFNVNRTVNRTCSNKKYYESTKSSSGLNKLDEIEELKYELNRIDKLNRIDQKLKLNQKNELNKIEDSVEELNQIDQLSDIDQLKEINKLSNQANPLNRFNKATKLNSQSRLAKLSKMFRKISNLKANKNDKKSTDKQINKFDKNRPLITVVHKTVTKNNVKLFTNTENENVSNNLKDDQSNTRSISPQSISRSINQSTTQSITHSSHLNESNIQFNNSILSSLSLINQTNRKIEDVKSRSETKLSNYNCQRKQSNKMKSESFYFLESQQSKTIQDRSPTDSLILNGSSKKQIKNSKELEEQNFLAKKLIAESLIKSNNREMNALLNTSSTDSTKPSSSISNLQEPNNASHKIPSYIGISCAISGYSTYSKYSNLGNSSERNSPSSNVIRRLDDPNLLNNNNSKLNNLAVTSNKTIKKSNGQFLEVNRTIESYNSFKNNLNRFNKLSHKNQATNHPNNLNSLQNFNESKPNHQFDSLDNSFLSKDRTLLNDSSSSKNDDDDNKSLVQKRIESLYGSNFASNWKENRSKLRVEKATNDSFRSPSCPPEFISNGFVGSSKKNLPVLKYIQNSIFDNATDHPKKDENAKPSKQTKSEETISLSNEDKNDKKIDQNSLNDLNSFIELNGKECNSFMNGLVDNFDLIKEDLLIPDQLNNLESIKEDLLTNSKDDLIKGIDELDNFKFYDDGENINHVDNFDNILNQANEMNEESYGGHWYLKKLDVEINKINDKISQIEVICLDENLNNREEIDGKIRCSIGKANLLINKKLSQFKDLCNKNINQTSDEQYKTLDKDLEGFYEMISYQIDDVHKDFEEILFLKNNNWIINVHNDLLNPSPRKAGSKSSSRSNSNANSRNNSKPSSRNASKEDLRRLKLREVKRKQQQNLQQNSKLDDIVIFLPNKNETKPDDL